MWGAGYTTETKGFNANGQLTSMAWSGSGSPVAGSLQYSYPATQNNGQVTQVVDSVSGETIVYQYDSLKRLTSATSIAVDPTTNRLSSASYDWNGNMTSGVGAAFTFVLSAA